MKWLILFFSLLKPLLSSITSTNSLNPIEEVKDLLRRNAAKVAILLFSSIALSIFFTSGIMMIAMNMSAQYDLNSAIYFNSMIGTGLGLAVISFLIAGITIKSFHNSFYKKIAKDKKEQTLSSVGITHPLQDALALLIADITKERELKRINQHTETKFKPNENQAFFKTSQTKDEQEFQRH